MKVYSDLKLDSITNIIFKFLSLERNVTLSTGFCLSIYLSIYLSRSVVVCV